MEVPLAPACKKQAPRSHRLQAVQRSHGHEGLDEVTPATRSALPDRPLKTTLDCRRYLPAPPSAYPSAMDVKMTEAAEGPKPAAEQTQAAEDAAEQTLARDFAGAYAHWSLEELRMRILRGGVSRRPRHG